MCVLHYTLFTQCLLGICYKFHIALGIRDAKLVLISFRLTCSVAPDFVGYFQHMSVLLYSHNIYLKWVVSSIFYSGDYRLRNLPYLGFYNQKQSTRSWLLNFIFLYTQYWMVFICPSRSALHSSLSCFVPQRKLTSNECLTCWFLVGLSQCEALAGFWRARGERCWIFILPAAIGQLLSSNHSLSAPSFQRVAVASWVSCHHSLVPLTLPIPL